MVNTYTLEVFIKTVHCKTDNLLPSENVESITIEVNFCELIKFNICHDHKENKRMNMKRNKIEINDIELQELKINSGTSALFLNNQEDFDKLIEQNPVVLTVYESSNPERKVLIGSSSLVLNPSLSKLLLQDKYSENLTPVHIEEILPMYDQNKKNVGLIMLSLQILFLGVANTSNKYCEWAIVSKISDPSISVCKNTIKKTSTKQSSYSDTCYTSECQNTSTCSIYSIDSCSSCSLGDPSEDSMKKFLSFKNSKALNKKIIKTEPMKLKCNLCKLTNQKINNCQLKVNSDKKKNTSNFKEIKTKIPTKQKVSKTRDNTEKLEARNFIYAYKNSDVCQKCEGIVFTKKIKGDETKYAEIVADMKYKCKINKKVKGTMKCFATENARLKNLERIYKP